MADDDFKNTLPTKSGALAAPSVAAPKKEVETDETRSKRRAGELAAHLVSHKEKVAEAHRRHPTPPGVKFTRLDRQQKIDRNLRRKLLDEHNASYAAAVKKTCAAHRAEDVARSRALTPKEAS